MKPTTPPTPTIGGDLRGATRDPYAQGGREPNPAFQVHTSQDSDGIIRNSDGTRDWNFNVLNDCDD